MYSIKDFLQSNGIVVTENKGNKRVVSDFNEYNISKHIELLANFHKRIAVSEGFFLLCFPSEIGKDAEQCKVEYKRLKRYISNLESCIQSEYKGKLYTEGSKILERCEKCLGNITKEEYISLIQRSMRKNEVCVGNVMEWNIFYQDGIKIHDISQMAFNLIEQDCIKYLLKLKRKGIKVDWDKVIDLFIRESNLDEVSKKYILSMISFPYEFFRVINKIKTNNVNEEEIIDRIEDSKIKDGEMLI